MGHCKEKRERGKKRRRSVCKLVLQREDVKVEYKGMEAPLSTEVELCFQLIYIYIWKNIMKNILLCG
jgi:hypothetical protein